MKLLLPIFFYPILTIFLSFPVNAQDVAFPGIERNTYNTQLIKHIFTYFPEKNYNLTFFGSDLPRGRDFDLMVKNQGIDVVIGAATIEREQKYLPVRFPITKGLNGWRISLVKKENKDLFKNITTLSDFKKLIPGQHHTWSDSEIFEKNSITVMKSSSIEGLYSMLEKERFDYFPRSILEIDQDLSAHKELNIMVEPYAIIHYPIAYYFYVCKNNISLANDLKQGLEFALLDGSFDKIFFKFHGKYIEKVKLNNRRVFKLLNATLPQETPLHRKELWLNLNTS